MPVDRKPIAALAAALWLLALTASAQSVGTEPIEQYFEELTATESEVGDDWQTAYDDLLDLAADPLDINTARREDFERLPFLTPRQIEEICRYRHTTGRLQSLDELLSIHIIDRETFDLLASVAQVSTDSLASLRDDEQTGSRQWLGPVSQSLTAAAKMPLYKRKGDRNGYLGYPWRHWLRYRMTSGRLTAGLTAAQDAGEPFGNAGNSLGYDYYSLYALAQDIGPVKTAAIGRYRLRSGMGLVLGSSMMLSKATAFSGLLASRPTAITAHSSTAETAYFQGLAANVRLGRQIETTVFFSRRPLDGTTAKDGTISNISYAALHRTPAEIARKHNTHATTAGAAIDWQSESLGLTLGLTALYTKLDRTLRPNPSQLYRRYYPAGDRFANVSINAAIRRHWATIAAEAAIDKDGNMAAIAAATTQPRAGMEITALYRYYDYRYAALYARSFSDGGRVQNENGFCLAVKLKPTKKLTLQAYTDYVYYAWPRYLCDQPSHALDNMLQATWSKSTWQLSARYRLRLRQRNNADKTDLIGRTEHRARLAATKKFPALGLKSITQLDLARTDFNQTSQGIMASQHIEWQHRRLTLHICANYFSTDDNNSRLYTTEHGAIYGLGTVAATGRGMRLGLATRWKAARWLTLNARIAHTRYFDRETISSGLQQINACHMTDIEVQAAVRI